jgi:hypothetical protein
MGIGDVKDFFDWARRLRGYGHDTNLIESHLSSSTRRRSPCGSRDFIVDAEGV